MLSVPAVKAQSKFGELLDQAQIETIEVTRYGRSIAYVVSSHAMRELQTGLARRKQRSVWLNEHNARVLAERAPGVENPSEAEMAAVADDLRS